jgi:hypothetical protein
MLIFANLGLPKYSGSKTMTAEESRLQADRDRQAYWRRWGPYLSERQWGTVREDYSADGNAWAHFPHDQARSRAYRWGEDGIAGISDNHQRLCFAILVPRGFANALWNGKDPILKERLFGLTGPEGNHGEDVKEYYFYLDNTPSHAYMKYLYKYPHAAFPYTQLVEENQQRGYSDPEFELADTGVFDDDRYFDIYIEYAKATDEDILIQITAINRGAAQQTLHLLPTLWFRNTWSWDFNSPKPQLQQGDSNRSNSVIVANHPTLGDRYLYCQSTTLLFTENETNSDRLFGTQNSSPYVPDFAKRQLERLTREWYMHPNGQIPAYEWHVSDVNPPVHAWATWRVYQIEKSLYDRADTDFLERVFQKLLLNFTWWVNQKDANGNNVFEGGFLGLDNIGIFVGVASRNENRSAELPTGGYLEQSDATIAVLNHL